MREIKNQFYYQIAVASKNVQLIDNQLPVYHSEEELESGQIVSLTYRNKKLVGVVIEPAKKPNFTTKPVQKTEFKLNQNTINLAVEIAKFYCINLNQAISLFVPSDITVKLRSAVEAEDKKSKNQKFELKLNSDQQKALNLIKKSEGGTVVLAGETGSGKSYIYLKLAAEAIERGKSAVILTPEISLSPQMINLFERHIDAPVFHVSSSMTNAQRRKVWQQAYKEPRAVIIGPRSSLFLPINNLSLIVIDEFHESTYKNDSTPKYNTQTVASMLSRISSSKLILGSATPKVQDIWMAEKKNIPIIKLGKQFKNKTNLSLVDSNYQAEFIKSKIFSETALSKISSALKQKKQVLIFHNQRGTSRALICTECDWIYKCPNCAAKLVFHQTAQNQIFKCHTCDKIYPIVTRCSNKHENVKLVGFGTRKIVEELSKLFPSVEVLRIDTDQKNIEEKLSLINNNQAEIIVGTQMLAKGHNFENLSLVVVPLADTGLGSYDFTAPEKTYQLLHQVIGRVGRFDHKGEVVIQSFNLNNKIIQLATTGDFEQFFDYEIEERRLSLMPPFSFALKVSVIYQNEDYAHRKLEQFISKLRADGISKIRVLGPSSAGQKLVSGRHKVQIIILSSKRAFLQDVVNRLPQNFNFDIDPVNFM
jgi:primosomal protein N' (replication factor Y)